VVLKSGLTADIGRLFASMPGFESAKARVLTNNEVTGNMLNWLVPTEWELGIDDVLVIFFAGHAIQDPKSKRPFLLPYDAQIDDIEGTAIPYDDLLSLLDRVPCRRRLLLLDACESGGESAPLPSSLGNADSEASRLVTRGMRKKASVAIAQSRDSGSWMYDKNRIVWSQYSGRGGAVVFSSSLGSEPSLESRSLENGLFTAALKKALGGHADADRSNTISMDEIMGYVQREVARMSKGIQHPTRELSNPYLSVELPVSGASSDPK